MNYLCPLGLWPYHPECTQSHLISETKQERVWLVLGWRLPGNTRCYRLWRCSQQICSFHSPYVPRPFNLMLQTIYFPLPYLSSFKSQDSLLYFKILSPGSIMFPLQYHAYIVTSVVSNSLQPYKLQSARLLCPLDSPGKNAGVGCNALLQGIFQTQGLSLISYTSCIGRWVLYQQRHLGSPLTNTIFSLINVQSSSPRISSSPYILSSTPVQSLIPMLYHKPGDIHKSDISTSSLIFLTLSPIVYLTV